MPITISSPHTGRSQSVRRAIADTGSDDTIFPYYMVAALGVPLLAGPTGSGMILWRGQSHRFEFGEVDLQLDDGTAQCRWRTLVAFSAAPLNYALLGQLGVLQFFDATFRGADQLTELEPNSSFKGAIT